MTNNSRYLLSHSIWRRLINWVERILFFNDYNSRDIYNWKGISAKVRQVWRGTKRKRGRDRVALARESIYEGNKRIVGGHSRGGRNESEKEGKGVSFEKGEFMEVCCSRKVARNRVAKEKSWGAPFRPNDFMVACDSPPVCTAPLRFPQLFIAAC